MRHSITMVKGAAVTALAVGLLAALQVAAFHGSPALAQALQPNPQIQVEYVPPKYNAAAAQNQYNDFTVIYAWLRVRQPLEEIQKLLAPLRLPRPIKIEVDTCGAERRAYVSGAPVTVCYELIDKIQKTAAGIKGDDALKQMVIVGTFTQAVLHELAYGVFDVLQVPVWGRVDDAADRLAAFVLLQFSGEVAHTAMVGSAEFFLLSRKTWTGSAFADARLAGRPTLLQFSLHRLWRRRTGLWRLGASPAGQRSAVAEIPCECSARTNTSKFAPLSICGSCPTSIRICCCRSKPGSGSFPES